MFFVVLVLCPPPVDAMPPVSLAEAEQWGLSASAARGLWQAAIQQAGQLAPLIRSPWNNNADTVAAWEAECHWRQTVWYCVDDVVGCPQLSEAQKLTSLERVRRLIGPEDYYAGRLPSPLCEYKLPAWRPRN